MRAYEYIRLKLDMGDLSQLNRLSLDGWHVAGIVQDGAFSYWALLERPAGDVVENLESLLPPDPATTNSKENANGTR